MTMTETQSQATQSQELIKQSDVARWITFSGFWGFVFYLLAFAGLLTGHRRQALRINTKTAMVGLGLHVVSFVLLGSLFSAIGSLVRGKSSTQQAREQIGSGRLERTILVQAAGGAAGSVVPFALAVSSLQVAQRITGKPALEDGKNINWAQAAGTTALLSGITALAVSRIAAWVARDARKAVLEA